MIDNNLKYKIWLLQMRTRYKDSILVRINHPITQKGKNNSHTIEQVITEKATEAKSTFKWKLSKRAKYAVKFYFSGNENTPALHNLVKFYLDPLRKCIFDDDRQVWYISASCPRVKSNESNESVFIEVEKISKYNRYFNLYHEVLNDEKFKERIIYDHDLSYLVKDVDEDFDDGLIDIKFNREYKALFNKSDESYKDMIKQIEFWNNMKLQEGILRLNKIKSYDRPGKQKINLYFETTELLHLYGLLAVNLGSLPKKGQSKLYKQKIREALSAYSNWLRGGIKLLAPVDMDVKITSPNSILGKDLDNIMRDIAPIFNECVLDKESYINGYRIYFSSLSKGEGIFLKPLPQWSINQFYSDMDKVFEKAEEWIKDEFYYL